MLPLLQFHVSMALRQWVQLELLLKVSHLTTTLLIVERFCCRYHALSLKGRRLDGTGAVTGLESAAKTDEVPAHRLQFLYRNYTDESYSIHVEVVRKAIRSCPRLSSKVERVLNLPTTVCNANGTADGGQCKMKLTFYPQVGYLILLLLPVYSNDLVFLLWPK